MIKNYKTILWDFDGVILDSMKVRDLGFEKILVDYPKSQVNQLMAFHHKNGGLSRYVKFKYFYDEIINEELSEERLNELTSSFSSIMKDLLTDESLLILDAVNFIEENHMNIEMHIVSGSDQTELRFLCQELGLSQYFKSINGSPTPKKVLVETILTNSETDNSSFCLVGDSINDFEAAETNGIRFFGYNNNELKDLDLYINSFT